MKRQKLLRLRQGWSILSGRTGLYYGSFHATRKEAIEDHCRATGRSWEYCKAARLDIAIKTVIFSVHP